jgi:hypothetical protein
MNAAGLGVVLHGVLAGLKMPFYESLVTDGSIAKDEFDGTLSHLTAVDATLKKTPHQTIEAMVAQHDEVLSEHIKKFEGEWSSDLLAGFRDAQTLAGYVTTIMAKSGCRV